MSKKITPLREIYDTFLSLITDDMYLELSEEETYADIRNIFLASISNFQFPRFDIYNFTEEPYEGHEGDIAREGYYNVKITREEINIISRLMLVEWVRRQLASVDVVRQAYSSRDFEFTSQANHLAKLNDLREAFTKESTRMQRLYTRRVRGSDGLYTPNYLGFGGKDNAN